MTYQDALRHHVQRSLMADLGLSWEDVRLDDDGDVGFRDDDDRAVYVRLVDDGHATWARVWTCVASGLKPSVKLLREVNDHNVASVAVRLLLTPQGALMAAAEVVAESVEPGELGLLVHLVSSVAGQVGELVRLVHGDPQAPDQVGSRP